MSVYFYIVSLFAAAPGGIITVPSYEEATVTLEVAFCDGSSTNIVVSTEDAFDFVLGDAGIDDASVFRCTARSSDDRCKATGPNCAAAVKGVIACLEESEAQGGPSEAPEE